MRILPNLPKNQLIRWYFTQESQILTRPFTCSSRLWFGCKCFSFSTLIKYLYYSSISSMATPSSRSSFYSFLINSSCFLALTTFFFYFSSKFLNLSLITLIWSPIFRIWFSKCYRPTLHKSRFTIIFQFLWVYHLGVWQPGKLSVEFFQMMEFLVLDCL